jgi:hypothetical protein
MVVHSLKAMRSENRIKPELHEKLAYGATAVHNSARAAPWAEAQLAASPIIQDQVA